MARWVMSVPTPGEIGSGFIDVFLVDTDGRVAFLVDAVVSTGDLGQEHVVVLLPVFIEPRPFHWDQQGLFKLFFVDLTVDRVVIFAVQPEPVHLKFGIIQEHFCLVRFTGNE